MSGAYPLTRPRRLRQAPFVRAMVRETRLTAAHLVQPLFVAEGALAGPIDSMPGCERLTLEGLATTAQRLQALGIPAIALFPERLADRHATMAEGRLSNGERPAMPGPAAGASPP